MIRTNTKLGDIFSVNITENTKKYFQYIANDLTQLNSDVIRAFKKEYSINDKPELSEITKEEVEFYAHCVTKFGIKMKLWEKIGNLPFNEELNIYFRDTNDYGHKVGEEPIKVSGKWYVWRINDKDFTRIGKLTGEYRKSDIGIVVTPQDIVDRMKTGKYHFVYPDFE
jgi:hypothetical protein